MDIPQFKNIDEYVKWMEDNGFWDKNGAPLKCTYCGSTNFKDVDEHYCQYGREEYAVECQDCKEIVGRWAYGYWQI